MPEIIYSKPTAGVSHNCVDTIMEEYKYTYYNDNKDVPAGTVVSCDCGRKYIRTAYSGSSSYAWKRLHPGMLTWWKALLVSPHPPEPELTAEEKAVESLKSQQEAIKVKQTPRRY